MAGWRQMLLTDGTPSGWDTWTTAELFEPATALLTTGVSLSKSPGWGSRNRTLNEMASLQLSTSRRLLLLDSTRGGPGPPAYLSGSHLSHKSGKESHCQDLVKTALLSHLPSSGCSVWGVGLRLQVTISPITSLSEHEGCGVTVAVMVDLTCGN